MARTDAAGAVVSKYDKHKGLVHANDMAKSREGRDIAPLPPVEDPARRAAAADGLKIFCETYFPRAFYLGWSKDHLRLIADIERAVLHGGLKALAMPRGSGKTTICSVADMWAALNGHRQFPVIIGPTARHAREVFDSIRMSFETNDLLAADYPEVCYPIRCLEGISQRCHGQLFEDERTHIVWRGDMLRMATLPEDALVKAGVPLDHCGCGVVMASAGLTGRVRGTRLSLPSGEELRPDFALVDDPQTKKTAKSETENRTRESLISADVIGMAGPDKTLACLLTCTINYPGDMADRMLDRATHPDWQGERCKMMYAMPQNETLWNEYAQIRGDELRNGGSGSSSTAFYEMNRIALDQGADPAWTERFKDGEVSAVQHAMNIFYRDKYVFASEYQNEPLIENAGDYVEVTADKVASLLNRLPQGVAPKACEVITAHVDVQLNSLWWVVMAWESNATGYVLDYGCYPDQGRPWFTARDLTRTIPLAHPGTGEEGAIYAALKVQVTRLVTRAWGVDGGGELRMRQALVDQGFKADVVHRFIRESEHAGLIVPMRGVGITASSLPISDYDRKRGQRIGLHWYMPVVKGTRVIRHIEADVNFWKSWVHARLATAPGDAGSLTLWGEDYRRHELFASHLCSEYRVKTHGRGREVDEWKQPSGKPDNHWFDCVVGCAVAASMHGVGLPGTQDARDQRAPIRLSELQRRKRLEREQ